MPIFDVAKLRNVALLSHSGAGKTAICEAALFHTKAITRQGRIEDGNTVSDYEPEEVKRGASVQTSLIPCHWNGFKINILDTPGYDDFAGEVTSALRVADSGVMVIAATSGVELGTERAWGRCEEAGIPSLMFINKMDKDNADFFRCVEQAQHTFGRRCIPFQVPIGAQQEFIGVVDVLNPPKEIPHQVASEVQSARERLLEAVAETDDALATKYLEGEDLTDAEILAASQKAILNREIVPIFVGSATSSIGIEELLDAMVKFLPTPSQVTQVEAKGSTSGQPEKITPDPEGPLTAFVFKTTADPFVGKLSFFRVYRGTFRSNFEVWNAPKGQAERVGQVYFPRGKTQENTQEVGPGDIAAVAKLGATLTGDTLCHREHQVIFEPVAFPMGHYPMAVNPKSSADLDKLSMALSRIVEEDPSLRLVREATTNESLFTGLGDTHLDIAVEKVHRKFGAELTLNLPKVAYKETITQIAKAEYKHKKQTGGHGQYGHVLLRLEPQERSEGFSFKHEVVGGAVPREYIPPVEKGVIKALQEGVMAGFPVVDLKVVLYHGSYHDVDSSGLAFEIAGSHAVRKGVAEASPMLLEPILRLRVTVPDTFAGDIIGDLNGRRGRITGMTPQNGNTLIETEVPQAEILRYAIDLRSLTQGRGSYGQEFSHYEGVPQNITQRIIGEAKRLKETAQA